MSFPSLNEQMDIIKSGAIEVLPEEELAKKIEKSIRRNKPLRAKLGCDPSKPDLHIGHAVVLQKLRHFQDLGHIAVLIIGDFTAMIGDPSGKSKTRPQLTIEETQINGKTYLEQATRILSKHCLEVRYNSEWLSKMSFRDVIELSAKYTVAQLLERDDFTKRYRSGIPISVHELLYPLAQAYDSYAIDSDVELGGTDQKFNLIVGREIQKSYGKEQQCIITMPILEGTNGIEKMSKSLDNYIAFTENQRDMFGKVMSIPDNLIVQYYKYGAWANQEQVDEMAQGLANNTIHPRDAKVKTAMAIVEKYYDATAAQNALEEFERIFKQSGVPDDVKEFVLESKEQQLTLADALVICNLSPSKKEAFRMIKQGAVSVDNEKIEDPFQIIVFSEKRLIKYGKKNFLNVISK